MKKLTFIFILFLITHQITAQDTFSIIAADPATGEVGAAGASCVDGIASFGGIKLLNDIIPGKGGVNAQAYVCLNPHINLELGIQQMEAGLSPSEIIDWLILNDGCNSQSFNPAYRQYGIVDFDEDMNVRTAAHTGESADDYKNHITGATYAIQGNILLGQEVLDEMENGFNNTNGSLAEKLMGAMQGANIPGADQRCLARGTSSTSAFLRVVKPTDTPGNPFLELDVLEMPFGEEPIDSLQILFDEWFATTPIPSIKNKPQLTIAQNPAGQHLQFKANDLVLKQIYIYNIKGQIVKEATQKDLGNTPLDISALASGVYLVKVLVGNGEDVVLRFVKE